MTDTTNEPTGDTTSEDSRDDRTDAIQFLARALWRERLVSAADATEGGAEADRPERAEWKEKRKDYMKLATRLYKRLDRHGATLTAPAKDADEDDGTA